MAREVARSNLVGGPKGRNGGDRVDSYVRYVKGWMEVAVRRVARVESWDVRI